MFEEEEEYVDDTVPKQALSRGGRGAVRKIIPNGAGSDDDSGGVPGSGKPPGLSLEELLDKLGGADLTGGSGGSSGGGGGGGGNDSLANALTNVYIELWRQNPPPGVIEQAVSAGLNPIQFREQLMADPSWRKSPVYKELKRGRMIELMQMLGARP